MRVGGDERQRRLDRDATALAGLAMGVTAILGAIVSAALNHGDIGGYGLVCFVGGATYALSLFTSSDVAAEDVAGVPCAGDCRAQPSRHRFPERTGLHMAGKIEILKDKQGDYQFQVRAKNGEIVAIGQTYPTKARAQQGVIDTLKAVSKAKVYDLTDTEAQ